MSLEQRSQEMHEVGKTSTLKVDWRASQETITRFTKAAFEHERGNNEALRQATEGISINGLLGKLGAPNSSLSDYPPNFFLTVPEPTSENSTFDTTMLIPRFYDQLTNNFEEYIKGKYNEDPDTLATYQKGIEGFRVLSESEHIKDRKVDIKFTQKEGTYTIVGLLSKDYGFLEVSQPYLNNARISSPGK